MNESIDDEAVYRTAPATPCLLINAQRFWRLNKKLFPKSRDPPSAMLDQYENLLTTQETIEARALQVYSERLMPNQMKEHLKSLEDVENKLCEIRLKLLKKVKSDPWAEEGLRQAVNNQERDKSRDALDHAN